MTLKPFFLLAALSVAVSCNNEPTDPELDTSGQGAVFVDDADPVTQLQESQTAYTPNSTTPAATFETSTRGVSPDNAVRIAFTEAGGVDVVNPFSAQGVTVTLDGQHVTVNATVSAASREVNYVLSGMTADGSFKIYSDFKLGLVFDGVSICNPAGAAVNVQAGKKISVTLTDGTANRLIDGAEYTATVDGEDMKGTFFSEGQLIFDGSGRLLVYGNAKHGICSDDYIRIEGGTITVNNAVSDAIRAKDYLELKGGIVILEGSSDGIEVSDGYLTVTGGTLRATTTGKGGKGIKAAGDITLSGGSLDLRTTVDSWYDSSKSDITSGSGVKSDANVLVSGDCSLRIRCTGKANKGISADGDVLFDGGVTDIITWGSQFVYGSLDSSPKAVKADGNLTVNSGEITLVTHGTGGEGLESKDILTINGGRIVIVAYDDCINATNAITINGGEIYCYSTANDGIDSNGSLTITGGTVIASGTTTPEGGLDCDNSPFKITGGTLIGIGGDNSTPTSSLCTQRVLCYNTANIIAGQLIRVAAPDGTGVTFRVPRAYTQQMQMVLSSPILKSGTTYTIYNGGTVSGGSSFHGLYSGESYTPGSAISTFNPSSMVTTVGTSSGNGPGGGPGRM